MPNEQSILFSNFVYSLRMNSDIPNYALVLVSFTYKNTPIKKNLYIPVSTGINQTNYLRITNHVLEKSIQSGGLLNYSEQYISNPMTNHSSIYDTKGEEIPYNQFMNLYQNVKPMNDNSYQRYENGNDSQNNIYLNTSNQNQQILYNNTSPNSFSNQNYFNQNSQSQTNFNNPYLNSQNIQQPQGNYQANYQSNYQTNYQAPSDIQFSQVNAGNNFYNPSRSNPNFYNPNQFGPAYQSSSYFYNPYIQNYQNANPYMQQSDPNLNLPIFYNQPNQYYRYPMPIIYRPQMPGPGYMQGYPPGFPPYPNMMQQGYYQQPQQMMPPYGANPYMNQSIDPNQVYDPNNQQFKTKFKTFTSVYKKQIIIVVAIVLFLALLLGIMIPLFVLLGRSSTSNINQISNSFYTEKYDFQNENNDLIFKIDMEEKI